MKHRIPFAFITLAVVSTTALGQLSDFLITNSNGIIYEVDGNTLQATEVVQLENGSNIGELLYVGNNEVLACTSGRFVRYNLSTGIETIEFYMSDIIPNPSAFDWVTAAGFTAQRNIYIGVTGFADDAFYKYGLLYNPHQNTFTEMARHIDPPGGLYFDFTEVDNHVFLATDWTDQTVRTLDAESGETISVFNTSHAIVSFITLDNTDYALTKDHKLFTYDRANGSMEPYGTITGIIGNLIGSTSMSVPQTSDINYDGARDFFDMTDFISSFANREPIADWNDDGTFDYYDISSFISDFEF